MNIYVTHCARCGKSFVPGAEHIYRDGKVLFCSWNCLCAHRKDKATKKRAPIHKDRNIAIAKMFLSGTSRKEISQKYNLSYDATGVAIRQGCEFLEDENAKNIR